MCPFTPFISCTKSIPVFRNLHTLFWLIRHISYFSFYVQKLGNLAKGIPAGTSGRSSPQQRPIFISAPFWSKSFIILLIRYANIASHRQQLALTSPAIILGSRVLENEDPCKRQTLSSRICVSKKKVLVYVSIWLFFSEGSLMRR